MATKKRVAPRQMRVTVRRRSPGGNLFVFAIDAKGDVYAFGPERTWKDAEFICADLRKNGVSGSVNAKGLRPFIVKGRAGTFHVVPPAGCVGVIV